jgi:hypothetical protein
MTQLVNRPENRKLRVGLLIDSFPQPRWIQRVIESINQCDFCDLILIVKNEIPPRKSLLKEIYVKRSRILWKIYCVIDNLLFRSEPDFDQWVDVSPLVSNCEVIKLRPTQRGPCDYFPDDKVLEILSYDLDVAFRFGFRIIRGKALDIARWGVWSYHHGDPARYRGSGAWEIMNKEPTTGCILQILGEDLDGGAVLYESWASTYQYSIRRNNQHLYWKSAEFATRALRMLFEEGEQFALRRKANALYTPYSFPLYGIPTNSQMALFASRIAGRVIKRGLEKLLFKEQWLLGYKLARTPEIATTFYNLDYAVPPKDRFWADPFPVERDGRYFVFIEEFLYRKGIGHISVMEIDPTGRWKQPVKVLEEPYSMSYPFVFEWKGDLYMIPETLANRTVQLYRCDEFPTKWSLERVLLENVSAVDTTLQESEGVWWMFVNMGGHGFTPQDELHIFWASNPLGPWRPHKQNPVKSDVRSSRPAGRLFRRNGTLYRPSQDSSVAYGWAICINRITALDEEKYVEEEIARVLPSWRRGITRVHTLNHVGRLTVVDGLFRRICLLSGGAGSIGHRR